MLYSCEDDTIKDVNTSHVLFNAYNHTFYTIFYFYNTLYGIYESYSFFELSPKDTTEVISLTRAGMEVEFEIYSGGINYKGVFNWSNVIDPSQPLLRSGCYVFWVMNLDSINNHAEFASKRDLGCQILNL